MTTSSTTRTPSPTRGYLASRLILVAAGCFIIGLAALLRFHDLGVRTFQADESVSSLIAVQASEMRGYEYLPSTHGPLPHFASAATFIVAGDNDTTARFAAALVGVLLALLPFAFRRELGRVGAVAAALGLAVSPSLLYYSRFTNPEIYVALFSFATAIVIWRYLAAPHRGYLYALSLVLALMFVSSEMALVIAPIFAIYLYFRTGEGLVEQMNEREEFDDLSNMVTHYSILGVPHDAPTKLIRRAYRDRIDGTDIRSEREAIAHAYGVLTNEQRRETYDRKLARSIVDAAAGEVHAPGTVARTLVAMLAGPITIAWPLLGGMRARIGLRTLPASADVMLVLTLLALPFYGPMIQALPFVGDRGFAGQQIVYVIGGTTVTPGGETPIMLGTLGAIFALAAIAGAMWRWNVWVICSAVFYGTAIAFFTGFFTNSGGVWTGFWGTMDYWSRPEAQVTAGPTYYYAMMLPVYEFLPLLVAALGVLYVAARGGARNRTAMTAGVATIIGVSLMPAGVPYGGEHRAILALVVTGAAVLAMRMPDVTKFLAFWSVSAFFAFMVVPARDPWLAVHIVLPLTLLAARLLNDAIVAIPTPAMTRPRLSVAFGPRLMQAGLGAAFVVTALVSMRTGMLASWGHAGLPQLDRSLATRDAGDTPVEILMPTQTAPDVRELRDAIARAALRSSDGTEIPIVLDTSHDFASSWLWYLRGYRGLELRDLRRPSEVPSNAIVLADSRNRANIEGTGLLLSLTFTQKWAFPQKRYSGYSASDIAASLIDGAVWGEWSVYIRDRGSVGELRSSEGVAFFPRELEAALPPSRTSDVLSIGVAPEGAPSVDAP